MNLSDLLRATVNISQVMAHPQPYNHYFSMEKKLCKAPHIENKKNINFSFGLKHKKHGKTPHILTIYGLVRISNFWGVLCLQYFCIFDVSPKCKSIVKYSRSQSNHRHIRINNQVATSLYLLYLL